MDKDIDIKLKKILGGSESAKLKILEYVDKDEKYKYYSYKGKKYAIELDTEESSTDSEPSERVVKMVGEKPKRNQSAGNKLWWDFVKAYSQTEDMKGKSRPFVVSSAKTPYIQFKASGKSLSEFITDAC